MFPFSSTTIISMVLAIVTCKGLWKPGDPNESIYECASGTACLDNAQGQNKFLPCITRLGTLECWVTSDVEAWAGLAASCAGSCACRLSVKIAEEQPLKYHKDRLLQMHYRFEVPDTRVWKLPLWFREDLYVDFSLQSLLLIWADVVSALKLSIWVQHAGMMI